MKVTDILKAKGGEVVTIAPDATVEQLLTLLADRRIGAVVVSATADIDGIISERDVVRAIAASGPGVLRQPVSDLMTAEVRTCAPADAVEELAGNMTQDRIRHIPVVDDGRLIGIVSIGDVVKSRIDQLTQERDHLISYVQQ